MDDSSSSDVRQNGSASELADLFRTPHAWQALEPERLRGLLFYGCLRAALEPAPGDPDRLTALHHLASTSLTASTRYAVVVDVGRALQRVIASRAAAEDHLEEAFRPFLVADPDPALVCAAASEFVSLAPSRGATVIAALVSRRPDEDGRAGLIAGLLQAGDSSVQRLLTGSWRLLGLEGQQTLALLIQSFHRVNHLTTSWLLDWVEAESDHAAGASYGIASSTLARSGRHALEHGVKDAGTGHEWPGCEYAAQVRKRLVQTWRDEVPALLPGVLEAWGLAEAALDAALLRAWQQATAGGARPLPATAEPVAIDVVPDWEPESESAMEWGSVSGSSKLDTLILRRTTRWSERTGANWPAITFLLHSTYSPGRVHCDVVAAWYEPQAEALAEAIRRVVARQAASGDWAPASGPAYLHIPTGFGLDRERALDLLAATLEQAAGVDANRASSEAGEQPPATGDVRRWLQEIAAPDQVGRLREEMAAAWDRTLESDE